MGHVLLIVYVGVERLWGFIGREACQGGIAPRRTDEITAALLGPRNLPSETMLLSEPRM
jgi:hypothetical protein